MLGIRFQETVPDRRYRDHDVKLGKILDVLSTKADYCYKLSVLKGIHSSWASHLPSGRVPVNLVKTFGTYKNQISDLVLGLICDSPEYKDKGVHVNSFDDKLSQEFFNRDIDNLILERTPELSQLLEIANATDEERRSIARRTMNRADYEGIVNRVIERSAARYGPNSGLCQRYESMSKELSSTPYAEQKWQPKELTSEEWEVKKAEVLNPKEDN